MADEQVEATDYLGKRSPVSLSGTPSLPVGGMPAGAAAGPVVSGTGVAPPGPASGTEVGVPSATRSETPGAPGAESSQQNSGGASSTLQGALAAGGRLAEIAQKIFGQGRGENPTITGEFTETPGPGATGLGEIPGPSIPSGELPGGATGIGEIPGPSIPSGELPPGATGFGEIPGVSIPSGAGAAGELASTVPETLSGAIGVLGEAAPIFGSLAGLALDLGQGNFEKIGAGIGGAAIGSLWGPLGAAAGFGIGELVDTLFEGLFGGPSKQWSAFGGKVGDTLKAEESANQGLATALASAGSPEDIQKAISAWKASVGQSVGGFGNDSGALDIPDMPGATGKPHEWKQRADFGPEVLGLRAEEQAALAGASPAERIAAFQNAAKARLAETQAAIDAAAATTTVQDPSVETNIGSA